MGKKSVNRSKKEGDMLSCVIVSETSLADGEVFFVLKDPSGAKYLLPKKYYTDYKLELNKQISCKIDKINCTGRIFLEPEHPVYREGEMYEFEFTGIGENINSLGEKENVLILRDVFRNEWRVPYDEGLHHVKKTQKITCKVEGIKKSRLLLHPVWEVIPLQKITEGIFEYKITGISILSDGEEYYKIEDEDGNAHFLRKKYYEEYDYQVNQLIKCRVFTLDGSSLMQVEPVHPFYNIGEVYPFKLISCNKKERTDIGNVIEVTVLGTFGKDIKFVEKPDKICCARKGNIYCKVEDIKKGRLYLSCADSKKEDYS